MFIALNGHAAAPKEKWINYGACVGATNQNAQAKMADQKNEKPVLKKSHSAPQLNQKHQEEQVKPNIVVVEEEIEIDGWLPHEYYLENKFKEFKQIHGPNAIIEYRLKHGETVTIYEVK
jgi:hypothetical protein